jgi:DNA-binding MarR family transcriptional regulator
MGSIREEIRQHRPFPSVEDEGVVTLLRTADTVKRTLFAIVAPHGITLQQYNVLRILRGAGAEGLPTLDVAERMIETAPGITRLLERLEAKRLVRRMRCPEDQRRVFCIITARASRILAALDGPMARESKRLLGPLGTAGTRDFIGLLDAARHAAASRSAPAEADR